MEYSRTFSAVPGHFRKKRKKFLTNPILDEYYLMVNSDNRNAFPIIFEIHG